MDLSKVTSEKIEQLQENALQLSDIPANVKTKIAQEYKQLCIKHPLWKKHRAMRKAGEAFNIKFEFE